jgi:sulfate permease, SulP family
VRRSYRPHTAVVLRDSTDQWRLEEAEPGRMIEPGLIMYWFGGGLFYANAAFFTAQVRCLVNESQSPVRWFVVDGSAITSLDFSAGRAIAELHQDLAQRGVVLVLARVEPEPRSDLDRLGLTALIGRDLIFPSRHQCLQAYAAENQKQSS